VSGSFLTDDLSTVFDTVDFSVVGTYTPDGGSATSINGIFDDEDLEVDVGEGSLILQRSAKFTCASGDVIGIAEGDALTVASVDYIITYFKDDGTGVTETYLEVV
jgi:hypothetical protein